VIFVASYSALQSQTAEYKATGVDFKTDLYIIVCVGLQVFAFWQNGSIKER